MDRLVHGEDRKQSYLLPEMLEDCIGEENPVRFIDAFIENIRPQLAEMGFTHATQKDHGRMAYDPCIMLKLYIYGYFYGIRSSRKLAREAKINIEVMWLLQRLTPDFRTIANFRRDNKAAMKKVFKAFNKSCLEEEILKLDTVSIDGSKFLACNAKDKNFTSSKLDDRLTNIASHIAEYMKALDNNDEEESPEWTKEELETKIAELQKRQELYKGYQKKLEETGRTQISLTDPESKLMKTGGSFSVSYNTQTAVDTDTHMIAGFNVTDSPTDHGQITQTAGEVKEDAEVVLGKEITLNSIADKGYQDTKDMALALEKGIVPNVIPQKGKEKVLVEFEYKESEITEEKKKSRNQKDISECIHAGVVPEVYEGILTFEEIKEHRTRKYENTDAGVSRMTEEEMEAKAEEGYFVRNAEANYVICPQGQILRQKSIRKTGEIRYCNKLACKGCKDKCTKSEFKEADFSKDTLIRPAPSNKNGEVIKAGTKKVFRKNKVCVYSFKPDMERLSKRMSTSEHPFGTIKRWMHSYYFLCRGKLAAEAESSLSFLAYNLKRVISMGKMPQLMKAFALNK